MPILSRCMRCGRVMQGHPSHYCNGKFRKKGLIFFDLTKDEEEQYKQLHEKGDSKVHE